MKAFMNAKEREIDDWKQLFNSVDDRFKYVGVQMPPGSNLGIIHFQWQIPLLYN